MAVGFGLQLQMNELSPNKNLRLINMCWHSWLD